MHRPENIVINIHFHFSIILSVHNRPYIERSIYLYIIGIHHAMREVLSFQNLLLTHLCYRKIVYIYMKNKKNGKVGKNIAWIIQTWKAWQSYCRRCITHCFFFFCFWYILKPTILYCVYYLKKKGFRDIENWSDFWLKISYFQAVQSIG